MWHTPRCDAATNCRLFCSVKQKAGTETLSVSILRSQTAQGEAHTCEQQSCLGPSLLVRGLIPARHTVLSQRGEEAERPSLCDEQRQHAEGQLE